MPLLRNLVAAGALVVSAGCPYIFYRTLFEGQMEDSSVKLEESVLGYEYKMTIEDPYMRMTLRDFGKDGSIDEWYLNCMDKGKICKSIEAGAHNPFMQRRYDYYMKRLNEQGVCHFSCPLKKPK